MTHPLISAINTFTPFPDKEAELLLSFFREKKFKRNDVLLAEGKVAHEAFFIMTGALRQFIVTEDGQERTCNFAFEGEFLTDLESFSRQSKSAATIVAMENSTCLSISCVDMVTAMRQSPASAELFRLIVERVATENIRRTKSMLSLSPEKQFEELVNEKPQILQRASQRFIAQYLGIAPESLSRIRKRLMVAKS